MFVVAGVTGNTGGATATSLLAAGVPVRVFVRDPEKAASWAARGAEVAVGDLADASVLARALKGAEAAYVLNPPAYTLPNLFDRARQLAEAILEATQRARPGRLVVLSSVGAHLAAGTGIILTNRLFEQILGDAPCRVTSPTGLLLRELEARGIARRARRVSTELSCPRRSRHPDGRSRGHRAYGGLGDAGSLTASCHRTRRPVRLLPARCGKGVFGGSRPPRHAR